MFPYNYSLVISVPDPFYKMSNNCYNYQHFLLSKPSDSLSSWYILLRATSHRAPSYGGVRTWVEGLILILSHRPTDHDLTANPNNTLPRAGRNNIYIYTCTSIMDLQLEAAVWPVSLHVCSVYCTSHTHWSSRADLPDCTGWVLYCIRLSFTGDESLSQIYLPAAPDWRPPVHIFGKSIQGILKPMLLSSMHPEKISITEMWNSL